MCRSGKVFFLYVLIFLLSCTEKVSNVDYDSLLPDYSYDPHTYAEPEIATITHADFEFFVDFKSKKIKGKATYQIQHDKANHIILDHKDIDIEAVRIGRDLVEAVYEVGAYDPIKGSSLKVEIGPLTKQIQIEYQTRPESAALQWLDPEQTFGKVFPFLYTQSQPHLARTWLPIQDSPGIKFTYRVEVNVGENLLALMSAENNLTNKSPGNKYIFEQSNPIPAYLIALAIGDLEYRQIGKRTGVYAEPSIVPAAWSEFSKTEEILEISELLCGQYRWHRYDLLILPPSFPFGGMEHPSLTFLTPTVIVGDQSLVSIVAHELAHAWSGNQVTCSTWNDLWLNEGLTVYLERRIMESLYGSAFTDLLNINTQENLWQLLNRMGHDNPDTRLKLDLKGRDPDLAMNRIAYDKGYLLVLELESMVGRENLDRFFKKYFEDWAMKSINSETFVVYCAHELKLNEKQINRIKSWIYLPGLPEGHPIFDQEITRQLEKAWIQFEKKRNIRLLDADNWNTHQWKYFISKIPRNTDQELLTNLNAAFNLDYSSNAEIRAAWLELCLYAGLSPSILPAVEDFLTTCGRRKFLIPLYQALIQSDQIDQAKLIYHKAKPIYHVISRQSVEQLLSM